MTYEDIMRIVVRVILPIIIIFAISLVILEVRGDRDNEWDQQIEELINE
tara:strand:+ start:236 stop:382 length:147 start_codon:yes stop_codon:yes gene_type:complete